jgi:hypothetical protein
VCMRLLAPRMASVGQASRHSVQPMHQASSMTATVRGPSMPLAGLSGMTGLPVIAARRPTPSRAAGRAAVDVRFAGAMASA